jgi:hypothetical protein
MSNTIKDQNINFGKVTLIQIIWKINGMAPTLLVIHKNHVTISVGTQTSHYCDINNNKKDD